ncbi:hypothetical protein RMATCC62417_17312 [Rhizopus microsporus]|nr:hypothetical protein RMATCC62417_17312 [Rhizopus microsporus]
MGNQSSKINIQNKKKQDAAIKPSTSISTNLGSIASSRRSSITEFFAKRKQSIASIMKREEDIKEHDREQRQHYLLKNVRKGNTRTLLDSPKRIVESGIGNGIWVLEMATQYPDAQVIGLDLKLPDIQLSNQTFYRANIIETWPIEPDSVDFLFQRNMVTCLQKDHWIHVFSEMFRVLKPGGSLELIEQDPLHHNPGPVLQALHAFYKEQFDQTKIDWELSTLQDALSQIGFIDIELITIDIPIGEWPTESDQKQFGFMNKDIQKAFLKNKKNEYMQRWSMSSVDYDVAVGEVCDEFEEYKSFTRVNCWMAKKPVY